MHKHKFIGSAIRNNQTFRYCECGKTLMYYGNNRKPQEQNNDDYRFYKSMAIYYKVDNA